MFYRLLMSGLQKRILFKHSQATLYFTYNFLLSNIIDVHFKLDSTTIN